jgi:hypothetical protein
MRFSGGAGELNIFQSEARILNIALHVWRRSNFLCFFFKKISKRNFQAQLSLIISAI